MDGKISLFASVGVHLSVLLASSLKQDAQFQMSSGQNISRAKSLGVELVQRAPKEVEVMEPEASHRHPISEKFPEPVVKKDDLISPRKKETKKVLPAASSTPEETKDKKSTKEEETKNKIDSLAKTTSSEISDNADNSKPGFVSASAAYFRNPPPVYPRSAREAQQEGVVRIVANVSEDGEAIDVKLKLASAFEALDHAALEAVKKWRFKPATLLGHPVGSLVEVPIRFKLDSRSR